MPTSRESQVKYHCDKVLALPEDQRKEYLRLQCPPDLLDKVEESLRNHQIMSSKRPPGFTRALGDVPKIDGYTIKGKLGQGGMGVVYHAFQEKLRRDVALKVLPSILADRAAVLRFKREAQAAARLHHTNIVPIYDFGESHDSHYYAMELIEGRTLDECIKSFAAGNVTTASASRFVDLFQGTVTVGHPSTLVEQTHRPGPDASGSSLSSSSAGRGKTYFRQVAQWMADAADALHYAHGQGIIHRDIKPGNMILSMDGRLMITDFGLAKTTDDTSISVVGALIGAIRYVSPEQAMAGRLKVDHRTDIWSLGVTLYELMTFVPAFPGTDQNQILAAIITKDPIAPRKLNPQIPQDLETICLKALEKSADHRFSTAREMGEDLRRWLDGFSITAKRAGLLRRAQKLARRHRAVTTAMVSALLIVALVLSFLVVRREWKAAEHAREGRIAEKDKDWLLAAEHYAEAATWRPNDAQILFDHARALQEQCDRRFDPRQASEALSQIERAERLNANIENLNNTYGVLLSMNGQAEKAADVFRRDLVTGKAAAHIYSNIAAVHFLDRNDQAALAALQSAIDRPAIPKESPDGEEVEFPYFHAYHELATIQLLLGDPRALSTIQRGIDLKPESDNHFGYYLVLARIHLTMPELRDDLQGWAAAEIADGLFQEKRPDPLVKRYLALGRLRAGQIERARVAIERASEGQDEPVFVHLLTALAEAKAGNSEAARAALEAANQAWPEELKESETTHRSRHLGMVWFESRRELEDLRTEVARLLGSTTGS